MMMEMSLRAVQTSRINKMKQIKIGHFGFDHENLAKYMAHIHSDAMDFIPVSGGIFKQMESSPYNPENVTVTVESLKSVFEQLAMNTKWNIEATYHYLVTAPDNLFWISQYMSRRQKFLLKKGYYYRKAKGRSIMWKVWGSRQCSVAEYIDR